MLRPFSDAVLFSLVNSTHELEPAKVRTFSANETTVTLDNLNSSMLYKFYLSAKTIKGSGPAITDEAFTVMETSKLLIHVIYVRSPVVNPTINEWQV